MPVALRDRLEALCRQGGVERPQPAERRGMPQRPERPGLEERIRRLQGAPRGTSPHPPRVRLDAPRLAELLGGELLAPGVIVSERRLPLTVRHGTFPLRRVGEAVRGLPEGVVDPRRVVFLDTETTGLSGGTGTVVFLLGLGRVEEDALTVRQYLLTTFAGEGDLLADAGRWVLGAEALVTYNGRSFDVPLVAARCRLARVVDRFSPLPQVDLLPPTRRAFGRHWDDCRLSTAERRLLRFEREDDLPGSQAPESWFAFIRRGDGALLPRVAEHNHWDVVSLAALLPALADVHADPGAWQADVLAVARALGRTGARQRAFRLLRQHRSLLGAEGLLELATFHRWAGEWDEACAVWETLARQGEVEAVERLAKYHEHVRRDFAAALAYAGRLPPTPAHDRRRARLRAKVGAERSP